MLFKPQKWYYVDNIFYLNPTDKILNETGSIETVYEIIFFDKVRNNFKDMLLRDFLTKENKFDINKREGNNVSFSSYIENRMNFLLKELEFRLGRLISDIEYNISQGHYNLEESVYEYFVSENRNIIMMTILDKYLEVLFEINKINFLRGDSLI